MGEMILNLLSSLDISKFIDYPCQKIDIFIFYLLLSLYLLDFETHVSTNSSHTSAGSQSFVFTEVAVHFH